MKIQKTFTVSITLSNQNELYSPDLDAQITNKLNKHFRGRCFNGHYIIDIVKFERSSCNLDVNGGSGAGIIHVCFTAEVLLYAVGEIIVDCQVSKIVSTGIVICKGPNSVIILNNHPSLATIREGQYLPVRVAEAKYTPFKETIAIKALPFISFKRPDPMQLVPSKIPVQVTKMLSDTLSKVEELEKELDELKTKYPKVFDTIYAATVGAGDADGDKNQNLIPLDQVVRDTIAGTVSYGLVRKQGTRDCIKVTNAARSEYAHVATTMLLEHYSSYLATMVAAIKLYHDKMSEHRNVWEAQKKLLGQLN